MSKDLFGIEAPDDDDDDELVLPYVIVQLIPADGWAVIMGGEDPGKEWIEALACFALVELKTDTPGEPPVRVIRPMGITENGQIEDVEMHEAFLCLVPPNGGARPVPAELQNYIKYARDRRVVQTRH